MSDVIDLLSALVATRSVNPALVPGEAGEADIAAGLTGWMEGRGFIVTRIEETPGRPNLVGVLKGSGGGRSLMLNGHVDTVTVAGYHGDPFDPRIDGNRLYGRGSYDMKAGVAAMLVAADRAARRGHVGGRLAGDIIVACVADEEHSSIGTEQVLKHFRADAAIVTEPSNLEITIAHKGFVWFDIVVEGRSAHGSRPDLGVDAIVKAGKLLSALEVEAMRLRDGRSDPVVGPGSVHASLISGGLEMSSYPGECRISIERRTIPGETIGGVEAELDSILARLRAEDPEFRASFSRGLSREPLEISRNAPIIAALQSAARIRLGRELGFVGMTGWTDCALIAAAGIPGCLVGPGGDGAHAAEEWVDIASTEQLADLLEETIVGFCGPVADPAVRS